MNKLNVSVIRNEFPIYATQGTNKLVNETAKSQNLRSFAYAKDDIKGFVKKIEGFVMLTKPSYISFYLDGTFITWSGKIK